MKKLLAALATALTLVGVLATPAQAATTYYSTNWGGGVDAYSVTRISGTIQVPTVSSTCGSTAMAAVWVGVGGWGTGKLAQLGVSIYSNGTVAPWYEANASNTNWVEYSQPMTLHPGDLLQLSLAFLNSNTEIEYKFYDVTTGEVHREYIYSASQYYSGTSADWIVERVNGNPVTNFGTIHWTNDWYGTPMTATNASPLEKNVHLVSNYTTDAPLVATSEVSGYPKNMTSTWKACS